MVPAEVLAQEPRQRPAQVKQMLDRQKWKIKRIKKLQSDLPGGKIEESNYLDIGLRLFIIFRLQCQTR
jgi:hypothetical protein